MIELLGITGGALFAAGCVPMAFSTWRSGHDLGTPMSTQWLLFLACAVYSAYLIAAFGNHIAFWFLVVEVASWGTALWYHYFPRKP